jgi:hypothetical protein
MIRSDDTFSSSNSSDRSRIVFQFRKDAPSLSLEQARQVQEMVMNLKERTKRMNHKEEQISSLERVLGAREEMLVLREEEQLGKEEVLRRSLEILRRAESNVQAQQVDIVTRSETLRARETALERREAELEVRNVELRSREESILYLEMEMEKGRENLEARLKEVAAYFEDLDRRDACLQEKEKEAVEKLEALGRVSEKLRVKPPQLDRVKVRAPSSPPYSSPAEGQTAHAAALAASSKALDAIPTANSANSLPRSSSLSPPSEGPSSDTVQIADNRPSPTPAAVAPRAYSRHSSRSRSPRPSEKNATATLDLHEEPEREPTSITLTSTVMSIPISSICSITTRAPSVRDTSIIVPRGKSMRRPNFRIVTKLKAHDAFWSDPSMHRTIRWENIPWPVLMNLPMQKGFESNLTETSVSAYLRALVDNNPAVTYQEKVREYVRRWHPDQFESKLEGKMEDSHRDMIMSGVRHVAKVLATIEGQIVMDDRYARSQALQ